MAIHNEVVFEDELVNHLAANGWLYSPNSEGYDRVRALYPPDVFAWLEATQPEVMARAVRPGHEGQDKAALLDRLSKSLDAPFESSGGLQGGTLSVLRRGFKSVPHTFKMAQFKPADILNPVTTANYGRMRVRVMRQVYYSTSNKKSIDLVLFVNGLPVATLELKTDFTQSVQGALTQYQQDRNPKGEPLLSFGRRALVHFAVSNSEVWMTTKLTGPSTRFLPFNRGNDGASGNPIVPNKSSTSYLWEQVFQRDAWLDILGRFMHLQISRETDPVTGEITRRETLLFPRFHQWESVTKLIAAARSEGPGNRYLIQHSAGSGKTNSIAWTAHQLSTLHDEAGSKIFDSVIVVTDRTVLDSQLQDAIRQIDAKSGVVRAIDDKGGAKSTQLAEALNAKTPIIVVTIQTFGFVADKLGSLPNQSFAIIADEAHSSQTGTTANKVREVLSSQEAADFDDGGEVDLETILAARMNGRANTPNISYFAYTATPKAKTLELFGRLDRDGLPKPFHLYTMQQAIEEEFILDVLQNYTPYKVAFKLAHKGVEYDSDQPLIEQSTAVKQLMQWVRLHEYNISQKVSIIVEHFRENVAWRLEGKAKAMVVTGSRKEAVRYKLAFDAYLKSRDLTDMHALVAFSGQVTDTDSGPEPFTEINMNPGLKGRALPAAFESDDYQVMLVANKFQTGFDQPLLVAMYVDKKLSGVAAVQTLSRLNRKAPKKGYTCVLDFVNDPQEILAAFQPYYRDAKLNEVSDPNVVVDLAWKLDTVGLWEAHEVEQAARADVFGKGNNALFGAISPALERFQVQYVNAIKTKDMAEKDKLELFRSDLKAFVNAYDFLSQIINFEDPWIEKLSIYARGLSQLIRAKSLFQPLDLSDVELVGYSVRQLATAEQGLTGEGELTPMTATGTGVPQDPKMTSLLEAVEQLNSLFDSEDFTDADFRGFATHVAGKAGENSNLDAQRKANTQQQFLESPDLKGSVVEALLAATANSSGMTNELFGNNIKLEQFIQIIGKLLYAERHTAI